jgi:hypothetical protein
MDAYLVVADIGSVSGSRFAWAAFDQGSGKDPAATGQDPGSCVEALVEGLRSGSPAALLLEAPMAVPVPSAATGWVAGSVETSVVAAVLGERSAWLP